MKYSVLIQSNTVSKSHKSHVLEALYFTVKCFIKCSDEVVCMSVSVFVCTHVFFVA